MQIFLIGHRGTGKTSLLQRLQIYGRGTFQVYDLDREIERVTGKTISEIFETQGEAQFRELEEKTLTELTSGNPKMICALGAGFPLHSYVFHPSSELIWVKRSSDSQGRIFLNRPRLNQDVSALQEYYERYAQREEQYAKHADWTYVMPEGLMGPCEFERHILGERLPDVGGILTLRSEHFRNPTTFRHRILAMGVDLFELRSDLLNSAELEYALATIPTTKILISLRSHLVTEEWKRAAENAAQVDWALELGHAFTLNATCVSLHQRSENETLLQTMAKLAPFEKDGLLVKWSPEIQTFTEIHLGLEWQQENPQQRSFLPRSSDGRWSWVRLLLKDRQKFNFFRDGSGSAPDQPTLHEWLRALSRPTTFAAVLGSPVSHSYSPMEHLSYARHRQMDFFAIDVKESEWKEALPILQDWGLKFAAVTAPLKKLAYESATRRSPLADELQSANTLSFDGEQIFAHNTDLIGFQEMVESLPALGVVVIWGGGGTLPVLQKVLPMATAYSARTGKPRDENNPSLLKPDTVVWAAAPDADLPPFAWKPKQVLDLNYREDSRAREYAQKVGAHYTSGLVMFRAQAEAQREEWEKYGK